MTTDERPLAPADPHTPASLCAPGHTTGEARTRLWRAGKLALEGFPVADISDHLVHADAVVWLDLFEPTAEDLAVLADEFSLHPLAVEDALTQHQRPKVDRYRDHIFVSLYDVSLSSTTGQINAVEIAAFITPHALVTVRKAPGFDVDALTARWDEDADLAGNGIGYLLYGLLDLVCDGYFVAVQVLDDALEDIEDQLFDDVPRDKEVQRRSFEMRKSLVLLRRVVLPMREVVNSFMRRDLEVITPAMQPYFQDVYDHVLRATEWTESLRDLVTTILETSLTIQGNRLNVIMKKLTAWAAIIAVPTAVTGYFGQNLLFPGIATRWGWVLSCALIAAIGGSLYVGFRKRDWL